MNSRSFGRHLGAVLVVAFGCGCSSGSGDGSTGGGATTSSGLGRTCAHDMANTSSNGGASSASDVVPLELMQTEPDGTMRFSLPVTVGGAQVDAQFDTGSSGFRILEGALPDSAYECISDTPIAFHYHSGLAISGVVAYAKVEIGSFSTPSTIPVMLVREVGCSILEPDCDAAGKTPETYTFFGPFKAILGVGMRNDATSEGVASPIRRARRTTGVRRPGAVLWRDERVSLARSGRERRVLVRDLRAAPLSRRRRAARRDADLGRPLWSTGVRERQDVARQSLRAGRARYRKPSHLHRSRRA